MKMFVTEFDGADECGAFGVYTTLEKAVEAVEYAIASEPDETILSHTYETLWMIDKHGTIGWYHIRELTVDY